MISQLELRNFKCFELLRLPLSKLTVLSGTNASGKSSVLQSLVLLHQTMRDHEWEDRLILNGEIAQAGVVSDIVDQVGGGDSFSVGIGSEDASLLWDFTGGRGSMSAELQAVNGTPKPGHGSMRWLLPVSEVGDYLTLALTVLNLAYITAERDGPREVYPLVDVLDFQTVGARGEYAVGILFHSIDEEVTDMILDGFPPTLFRQVEARMGAFFPGCRLEVQKIQGVNAATLRIKVSEETGFLRPIHCGFGITQVLPIVVGILSSRVRPHREPMPSNADSRLTQILTHTETESPLILIENPEVHLHPAGQALMGQFLAEAAQSGVQIIVETHSDHVLNGIRRAVKSGVMDAEDVAIHFFRDRFAHESQVLSPVIDPTGNIDTWPHGFFDQFDKDLNYFAGWGE